MPKNPTHLEFNMLVLPDSTKEPAKKVKLPVLVAAAAACTKKKKERTRGEPRIMEP